MHFNGLEQTCDTMQHAKIKINYFRYIFMTLSASSANEYGLKGVHFHKTLHIGLHIGFF
jgi:hypothetical protein